MSEWQPIETAPKNVDVLISVVSYDSDALYVGEARYHTDYDSIEGWRWANTYPDAGPIEDLLGRPTHWMHLPAPPRSET